ncbi:MAG TPA: ATP-binding protein [Mucilaginibacter sp.]|nr:ATP-binding protein [Mucilaginibacter sp.]
MMKKILLFSILTIICCHIAAAQVSKVDSLQKAYQKNKQDTTLVMLLMMKSTSDYLTTNTDSGMICAQQGLALARKIGFKKGEVRCLAAVATFQNISGDLPGSLKTTFETLPEALKLNEMRVVASCYNTLGLTYSTLKDSKKSLDNYYSFKNVVEKYHYNDLLLVALNNIARQYLDMNRLDSAAWFNQAAYNLAVKKNLKKNLGYLIRNSGIIQFKKGNMQEAINFYKNSLADSSARDNHYLRSEDYRRIAEAYQRLSQTDSCIAYAKRALEQAKLDRNPDQVQRTTTLLTDEYKLKGDYKNAFYYQQVTQEAKDSLFSQQKTLQVQNLAYNEEQRKQAAQTAEIAYQNRVRFYALLGVIGVFLLIAIILLYANGQRKKANVVLKRQNEQIETQRRDLEKTVSDLKTTQKQLIQSEKMASLGELTAGIAHEIQNPLNFVNNFSEVNTELIDEMEQQIDKGNLAEVRSLAEDIKANQEKISQHGKRADFIVKGMLQHSRASTGEKQETNLNVLADEFFKLSFHGLRAKDKSFNAEMATHFDPNLPKVNVVQQDIGRVLLNLINNAFYAVNKKAKIAEAGYKPTVELSTLRNNGTIEIHVKDNGTGIPDSVKDKIMQPFFTTKPTGEGTGLGLSLSYDIVVKGHGGSIKIDSTEGAGSEFIISLPIN